MNVYIFRVVPRYQNQVKEVVITAKTTGEAYRLLQGYARASGIPERYIDILDTNYCQIQTIKTKQKQIVSIY